MAPNDVLQIMQAALQVTVIMVSVVLLPALGIGLLVSMFQAATQINEQTLSFLPRLVVTLCTIMIAGPWLITRFMDLFNRLFADIPSLIG